MAAHHGSAPAVHPTLAQAGRVGLVLLALGLSTSRASAQINQIEVRAADGTAYQILSANLVGGTDQMRITSIGGAASGVGGCNIVESMSGGLAAAIAGALSPFQMLHPYNSIVRSAILSPNDATIDFNANFGGRVTLGSGGTALNICANSFDCTGAPNVQPLVALSSATGGVPAACIANGVSAGALCDGTSLRDVFAFGLAASGSPPVCNVPGDVTVQTTICAPEPSDGFVLSGNHVLVLVYDSDLAGQGFAVGAAGFGIDTNGVNPLGCAANSVVSAQTALLSEPAPPPPTITPTTTPTPTGMAPSATATPTTTSTSSASPSDTPPATPTNSPSASDTITPTPSATSTPPATATHTATPASTLTDTPTPTATGTSTSTGTETQPATPTATPNTPTPEMQVTSLPGGGTATTDTEGDGATAADPLETTITSPNAGTVSITETSASVPPPVGFTLVGQVVDIGAPPATASAPLVIVFEIAAAVIPAGSDQNSIQILKDGVLVPACAGAAGVASPDPCVASRQLLANGNARLTVLTSSASEWSFAVRQANHPCAGLRGVNLAECKVYCQVLDCDSPPRFPRVACRVLRSLIVRRTGEPPPCDMP